jgi:hypothetical protein
VIVGAWGYPVLAVVACGLDVVVLLAAVGAAVESGRAS